VAVKETSRKIPVELLAPARNVDFGKAAINHGADAVYIGASQFGARIAAGNTISEIEELIRFAHFYRAKVYATLNTILYDNELIDVRKLIQNLYESGIDGIIIQDMGILELDLPPVRLIASTQTHNDTAEKVSFLEKVGFSRIILARELSLDEIQSIRSQTTVELEFFVHGALCVSFSGQCYMSQVICKRSGNRGACAQPCRSVYNLLDRDQNILIKNKHLLSLKDLQLSDYLENLLDVGITSFKIEGRLKDISYVKNIVSHYRQELDKILENRPEYGMSSSGKTEFSFQPDPERTFNRGYTAYFLNKRTEKIASFLTQKSLGKKLGIITEVEKTWFKIKGEKLSNGDGLCFFNSNGLEGTLINKVDGEKIFPQKMDGLYVGLEVFRNHDHEFDKMLCNSHNTRNIDVEITLSESPKGFKLTLVDEDGVCAELSQDMEKIVADKPDAARGSIIRQLEKLGETRFKCRLVTLQLGFIPFLKPAILNQMRRTAVEKLVECRLQSIELSNFIHSVSDIPYPQKHLTYLGNVSNQLAKKFYERHGVETIEPALELSESSKEMGVMTTKHCIRYHLDACPVHQKSKKRLNEPLFLKDNHHIYRLDFDCKQCIMKVILI